MNAEQLQAVKERFENIPQGWTVSKSIKIIEQMKKDGTALVAEVERLYEQIAKERKEHLLKIYDLIGEEDKKLVEENNRLREALEYYASTKTYETDVVSQWEPVTLINQDLGEKARQALEGEPND